MSVAAVALAFVAAASAPRAARAGGAGLPALPAGSRAALAGATEDKLNKKPCVNTKHAASLHCRDRAVHFKTNEWFHHVWLPYIRGVGGGYVGVGSDQGLTLVAAARSSFAWLIDYDPQVVLINKVHRGLILASATPQAFLARWGKKNRDAAAAALRRVYGKDAQRDLIVATYQRFLANLRWYFSRVMARRRRVRYHWLHTNAAYGYVRAMYQAGRIRVMKGDLLGKRALASIGQLSRRHNVPVRVLYLSNAEDYWRYTKGFRNNIRGLKFDSRSLVLRTRSNRRKNAPLLGRYQYVVQRGEEFQTKLASRRTVAVWTMLTRRVRAYPPGLFTLGLRPLSRAAMRRALPGWRYRRSKGASKWQRRAKKTAVK